MRLSLTETSKYLILALNSWFRGPSGALRYAQTSGQIKVAMDIIKNVKTHGNHITEMLSMNDLIQLAGFTAVEYCGGPAMVFRMGRTDVSETDTTAVSTQNSSGDNNIMTLN